MNLVVFDIHVPNVNKYFIVMCQLSNRLYSNASSICSDGAFMMLVIILGLKGKWKCLKSLENSKYLE